MAEADIEGAAELAELFRGAGERLFRGLPVVLQEGANTIIIDARHNHGYTTRTGNAERATTNEVRPHELAMSVYLSGDLTTRDGFNYVEGIHNGTKPHEIKAKNKKALHFDGTFAKRVMHPGTEPDPFLKEANARHEEEIKNAITEEIWLSLTQEQ